MLLLAVSLITLMQFGLVGWLGITLVLAAATFAPFVVERISPDIEQRLLARFTTRTKLGRFSEGALGLVEQFRRLISSPALLAKASLLTLATFTCSGLQVWALLAGLGVDISVPRAVAVYSSSQVGGTLSTLPFGIGSMDAVMVTVLAGYGVTLALSATVVILMRATATLPQAVAGLVAYWLLAFRGAAKEAASEPAPQPLVEAAPN
jgi:uncharacterized protein (TIRG00374 family)